MFMILLVFLASLLAPLEASVISEKIEARVGSQIIATSDILSLESTLRSRAAPGHDSTALRQRALDLLIEQALIREYLKKREMLVSDQDVERRIHLIRSSQGISDFEEFKRLLESQGSSLDQLRTQLREQMEAQNFIQSLKRESLQSVQDSEIESFYNANRSKFQNTYELEISECLIAGDQPNHTQLVEKYLNPSASFDTCVTQHSRAPSAARMGRLGKVAPGLFREDVEARLFSAAPGTVIAIPSPIGTQLLKILSKESAGPRSLAAAKNEITQILENEKLLKAKERALSELKASTFIKIES